MKASVAEPGTILTLNAQPDGLPPLAPGRSAPHRRDDATLLPAHGAAATRAVSRFRTSLESAA